MSAQAPASGNLWAMLFAVGLGLVATTPAAANKLDDYLFGDTEVLARQMAEHLPDPPPANWIEDPQLRVTPELDVNNQRTDTFSVRFRPVGRKERRAVRALYETQNALVTARWSKALSAALAERYHLAITLAAKEAALSLQRNFLALERALLDAEHSMAASGQIDAGRAASAGARVTERERELQQLVQETQGLRRMGVADYLRATVSSLAGLSTRLATPAAIEQALGTRTASGGVNTHDSTLARLELERTRHEMALEHSRSKLGIDLAELSYENKGVDSYNMTIGIRLPFAQRKLQAREGLRAYAVAQQQTAFAQRRAQDFVSQKVRQIRARIERYHALRQDIDNLQRRLAGPARDAGALTILRREQLDLIAAANDAHAALLHDYVDLLDSLGDLQTRPLRNWIDGDQT